MQASAQGHLFGQGEVGAGGAGGAAAAAEATTVPDYLVLLVPVMVVAGLRIQLLLMSLESVDTVGRKAGESGLQKLVPVRRVTAEVARHEFGEIGNTLATAAVLHNPAHTAAVRRENRCIPGS